MLLPETERVIYRHSPLMQVICQLRFPTILRIGTEPPVDFQERIRHKIPDYEVAQDDLLPESFSQVLPPEMQEFLSGRNVNPRHQFFTKGKAWTVSLARDFVALETNQYSRWEEFREYMRLVLAALVEVYSPAYLTRIGLRYKNVIDRRSLGLDNIAWRELIANFALGELALEETHQRVIEQQGRSLLRLNEENDFVRLEYGQVIDKAGDPSNKMYLLDYDFYTSEEIGPNVQRIVGRLNEYNAFNRKLFRWCINDKLHNAMAPESI